MTVRKARREDAGAIATVHVRSWQAAYRGLLPDEFLASLSVEQRRLSWQRQLTGRVASRYRVLVVEHAERIVGFASVGPTRDRDDDPEQVGELYAIYLLPEEWGRGIGRDLHSMALEALAAAGFAEATLWVLDTNARARRFYELAGWQLDGAEKTEDIAGPRTELRYRRPLALDQ